MERLTNSQLVALAQEHSTPLYVYESAVIEKQIERIKRLEMPYGKTIRYAMKANPHSGIINCLYKKGIAIDASSSYEVSAAIEMGVKPEHILLTSQQAAHNLAELVERGVAYNATSLRQLDLYGQQAPNTTVSVRINPGIGSGHSKKTNVGGATSSFGIWYEYINDALALADKYRLRIERVHTHIGSGTDPIVWREAVERTMNIVARVPSASIVNFGGGFKVARGDGEQETPIETVGGIIREHIERHKEEFQRELHVELEPGTFFVANAGTLIAKIDDVVDTGEEGYRFIKLNTGMNDILRPTLYGAQHPIEVLNPEKTGDTGSFVVVGHNCESGDVLSVAAHDPEELQPRPLSGVAVDALIAIGGTGAYCASMSAHGYNSFPSAREIIV